MHTSSGILFNHKSPVRSIEFATRKVTYAVARIKQGKREEQVRQHRREARLGLRGTTRIAMWLTLQQEEPDNYDAVAPGRTTSIRDMCKLAFAQVGW